jgi:alcohol dehydrogenase class IV
MHAYDLHGTRRIDRANALDGSQALAANDERVIAAEMHSHLIEGVTHGACILGVVEVSEGLVRKHALGHAWLDGGRDNSDSHSLTSLRQQDSE